jgi:hypothetical protein
MIRQLPFADPNGPKPSPQRGKPQPKPTPLKRGGTEDAEEIENRVIGRSGDPVIGKAKPGVTFEPDLSKSVQSQS